MTRKFFKIGAINYRVLGVRGGRYVVIDQRGFAWRGETLFLGLYDPATRELLPYA